MPILIRALAMPMVRMNSPIRCFCPTNTCSTAQRTAGGEEILMIEGVFEDEHGSYPAGSWIRSPHGSQHTPFSNEGCLIFVKTGHLSAAKLPSRMPTLSDYRLQA